MNSYVTGSTIKLLRKEKGISQLHLANEICLTLSRADARAERV